MSGINIGQKLKIVVAKFQIFPQLEYYPEYRPGFTHNYR